MMHCKPMDTPLCARQTHSSSDAKLHDPTLYRSIVGGLHYLTFTSLEITYAVNSVSQHMHVPLEIYWQSVKRILCYIKGTISIRLQLYKGSSTCLVAYNDTDWANCLDTRLSIIRYYVFLGNNLIS